jgi:hypothetical protein
VVEVGLSLASVRQLSKFTLYSLRLRGRQLTVCPNKLGET